MGYCLSSPYDVFTSNKKNDTEIQEILQQLGWETEGATW
jgi:hypothetical protein